jgi:hypothetical protein
MKSMLEKETATRINVTIPPRLARFLDEYQTWHKLESRSAVVALAIQTLKDLDMKNGYAEQAEYQRNHPETFIGLDISDGLEPEDSKKWTHSA